LKMNPVPTDCADYRGKNMKKIRANPRILQDHFFR
jgi:hypothetical protein